VTEDEVDQGGVVARAEAVLSSGHVSRIVARRQERVTVNGCQGGPERCGCGAAAVIMLKDSRGTSYSESGASPAV